MPIHAYNKATLKNKGMLDITDEDFKQKLVNSNLVEGNKPEESINQYFKTQIDDFFFQPTDKLKLKYQSNFAKESEETIELANRFLKHDFEFLGKKLNFNNQINYHYGFDQDLEPNTYFADINYLVTDRDIKLTWELNRQQYLPILAKAYFITGDEKYAQEVCTQIDEWIKQNPYLMGVNWIEGIEASIRMYSWIFAYQFIKNSPFLTAQLNFKILKYIYLHGQFIRKFLSDKWIINGNHLLAELSGLILIGTCFPEFKESKEWVDFAIQKLEIEVNKQVFDDGAIWEHSTGYQKFVTEMILYPMILLKERGREIPESILIKLEKMVDFLNTISMSSGNIPLIGDEDQGFMLKINNSEYDYIKDITTCGSILFKKESTIPKSELAFWLFDGLITSGNKISVQNPKFKVFENSGYCVFKSAKDYLLLVTTAQDKKYLHAPHRHLDMLSFTYEFEGEYFIVDSGTYVYNADKYNRNLFRSTWMHNTLTIDNKNPCYLGPFELQPKPYAKIIKSGEIEGHPFIWAAHDGYKPFEHNRIISQVEDGYLIYDFIDDHNNSTCESYIHLHPHVTIDAIDDNHLKLIKNSTSINLFSSKKIDIIESEFSPKYGILMKSKSLKMTMDSTSSKNMILISRASLRFEDYSFRIIDHILSTK
jgi:uncharacterized heparinase superfamily protein